MKKDTEDLVEKLKHAGTAFGAAGTLMAGFAEMVLKQSEEISELRKRVSDLEAWKKTINIIQ